MTELFIQEGDKVNVGDRIAFIGDEGEKAPAAEKKESKNPAKEENESKPSAKEDKESNPRPKNRRRRKSRRSNPRLLSEKLQRRARRLQSHSLMRPA